MIRDIRNPTYFKEQVLRNGGFVWDVEHENSKTNKSGKVHGGEFKIWGSGFAVGEDIWFERDLNKISELVTLGFNLETDSVAYYGKYDYKCLVAAKLIKPNFYPKSFYDPMIAVNMLDESRHQNQLGLDKIVKLLYDVDMKFYEDASEGGPDSVDFVRYACDDVLYEQAIWKRTKAKLESEELLRLAQKVIFPVSLLFAEMEINGLQWDRYKAMEMIAEFQEIRHNLKKTIYKDFGYFNMNSPKQLREKLFSELGVSTTGIKRTKGGELSTDAETLESLAHKYPACKLIVSCRTAGKMIGTYLRPNTRKSLDDPDGRIHPRVGVVSATGRTTMSDPNCQNQPGYLDELWFKGLSMRDPFIPRDGCVLLVADASQIELRLCGHISGDPSLLRAYREWRCTGCGKVGDSDVILHNCPECGLEENEGITRKCPTCNRHAVKVDKKSNNCAVCRKESTHAEALVKGFFHGLDLHQQTADKVPVLGGDRGKGKPANFQLVYGATARSMNAYYPGLSVRQWEEAREQYFAEYKGVEHWHSRAQVEMSSTGVCRSPFGRKRRISKREISRNFKHALNQFINFAPQCGACELIELALLKVRAKLLDMGVWNRGAWFNNFVHDEVVFDVRKELISEVAPVIHYELEHAAKYKVPIRSNVKVVERWSQAK